MTFVLEGELLTPDEAREIFAKDIDAAELAPYVAWINRWDVGDNVNIPTAGIPSVARVKRMATLAAKQHQAGKREPNGKRTLFANPDGTARLEPVKLRWNVKAHKRTEADARTGKVRDVTVVDRLAVRLLAGPVTSVPGTAPSIPASATPAPAPNGQAKAPEAAGKR